MKLLATTSFLACSAVVSFAAYFTFDDGVVNTSGIDAQPQFQWVLGTHMFQNIIDDYFGSPGPTGASAATQSGFDLFDPGGGGLDITLLSWTFVTTGSMPLYTGPGSLTLAPTATDPGAEDYRYDITNGTNLEFYYDGDLWAEGYVTRFVVEVDNNTDLDATGWGNALVTSHSAAGEAFFNELMALSSGTGELFFEVDEFNPIVFANPGSFQSIGTVYVVPEPATWASLFGTAVLALTLLVRRRRSQ